MAYGTYKVTLITKNNSSGKLNTTENGNSEAEIKQKILKRYPGCKIISIEKK